MRLAAILVTALLLAACGSDEGTADGGTVPLRISTAEGDVTLQVEVADTLDERAVGLMHRASLPEDAGMVFLWGGLVEPRFTMRNTLIPLQIAFWDEDGTIVAILDMVPCEAEPCPPYEPKEMVAGAVEANAGWFTDHGVEVGDTVTLDA